MSEELYRIFGRERLENRQIDELIGLAHGLIADGVINQAEAEYLQKWLIAQRDVAKHPIAANLLFRVNRMLADKALDAEEAQELFDTLRKFSGSEFELGEVLKSSELPLDDPPPAVICAQRNFCFTGTFAFGGRLECEKAVVDRGGKAGSLTKKTNYLVIGIYATGSWKHSCWGNKIERALEFRQFGVPLAIVGEQHWRVFL